MSKNEQFTESDLKIARMLEKKVHLLELTIISFHEVEYSYDVNYFLASTAEVHDLLKGLVKNHLTDKSLKRIDDIFTFLMNKDFLTAIFKPNSQYHEVLGKIVIDLHKVLDTDLT